MIPELNTVLFFLTILFGLEPSMVANETELTVDLRSNTVEIVYQDLRTSSEISSHVVAQLKAIERAESFAQMYSHLLLEKKEILSEGGRLDVNLKFSFNNKDEMLRVLRFNLDHHGEADTGDALRYHVLPSEVVVIANSEIEIVEDADEPIAVVEWENDSTTIHLKLRQATNSPYRKRYDRSANQYWVK